jgi:hypothetical protein
MCCALGPHYGPRSQRHCCKQHKSMQQYIKMQNISDNQSHKQRANQLHRASKHKKNSMLHALIHEQSKIRCVCASFMEQGKKTCKHDERRHCTLNGSNRTILSRQNYNHTPDPYLGSPGAHKPQAVSFGAPQFKFKLAGVPSIQAQPRFPSAAVLDCDAPTQKSVPETLRENAYRALFIDTPAIVRRCEFIGQAAIAVIQSKVAVPVTVKHDAWPSEPSLSL